MSKWRVGIYVRLSADDGLSKESNSITNQKNLIKDFLSNKKDMKIVKIYADDGYTGTDFERPQYKKMMDDIFSDRINTIIVKDLSRLGRNSLGVDHLLEELVQNYNVRFISVNEGIDSLNNPDFLDSIEITFKNLINESYVKDTSKKIRSSFKISKKNGKYIGVIAPFGYIKDNDDCHKFKIDDEAAQIVKIIFNYALKGKTKIEIVEYLNLKHILTPSQYIFLKEKKTLPNKYTKWNTRLVDSILKNEVYIGSIIQGKRKRVSHKNHSIVRSCEEEWIKTEEHHKPIISSDVFFQVQNIMYNRNVRANNEGKFNTFSGYLKCSDCNCNLHRLKKRKGNIEKVFYYCGTYLKKKQCKKHYITEDELNITVLKLLNNYIELICNIEDKLQEEIVDSSIEYTNEVKNLKIIKIDKEIDNIQKLLDELKNDYKNNYISDEDFDMFKSKYLYNLNNLKMEKESLNNNIISKVNLEWIKRFKKIGKLETLNKNIIDEFIDNIYVDDDRNIRIEFKFKSNYEEAIMYLKNKENMV